MSEFLRNCSLCEECESLSELQTNVLTESAVSKLFEFISIGSIVVALHFLDILICSEFKLQKMNLPKLKMESRRLVHIICLTLLLLILPLITVLIAFALVYKVVCSVVIKRKDKRFVKFLDSFDVFCCLEDKTTIDIQGVIQSNAIEQAVDKIKEKLHNVFTHHGTDKIFYRRNEEYGFYYWRRYSFIDLAQYVKIVEVPEKRDVYTDQEEEISNKVVSYNDEGLFKVLIVKSNYEDGAKDEYKVILKFHHSVKDSTQLEFVAHLIQDESDCNFTLNIIKCQDYNSPNALMSMISKLCVILAQSLEDNISRNNNSTDGSFIRMKALEWTKSDENLHSKVKNVANEVCSLFR